jgi:hypothetical protein
MAVDAFKSRHFKLSISSDRIADRASVEVSSPQAVFIADVPSPYAAGSKKRWTDNERLRIGAVAYFGRFSWGDSQQPLRWTFPGFNEPVVLKLNRKLVLTDLKQAAFPDLSGLDRLVLNNGTILPCRVMGIGEDGVRIESPFCEVKTIPTDQYRACFFVTYVESSQTQPLTQESVQRMLTIPRFTRDLEPTHVLMTVTGDLLRGTLVSVGKKFVMFDSRGEPLRVERQRVERQRVGVIVRFQSSLTATGKDITEGNTKGASSPKNVNVITINYGNDFVIIGELRASEPQLEINVPQLGFCQIPSPFK